MVNALGINRYISEILHVKPLFLFVWLYYFLTKLLLNDNL